MARIICCREDHNSLLTGTNKRILELGNNDHEKISASLSLCQTEVSSVCSVCNKCFLKSLGYEGMVLSSKESIIILLHGNETVVSVDRFLSVRCAEQNCRLLGEGTVKLFPLTDNGQTCINLLNGFPTVVLQPSGEKVFLQTEDIQRKVMLYPCGVEIVTVVDYMRKQRKLPYEVTVPAQSILNKMTCYSFKENSLGISGMAKHLVLIG